MQNKHFRRLPVFSAILFLLLFSCKNTSDTATSEKEAVKTAGLSQTDMTQVRAEIQAIENRWADGLNTKNFDEVLALYADDAVSFPEDTPPVRGKESLRLQIEKSLSKWPEGGTVSFETLDVFGDENTVTEVGKEVMRGAGGKVISTGKYMAVFQKKGGRYYCIRDIYNSDQPKP